MIDDISRYYSYLVEWFIIIREILWSYKTPMYIALGLLTFLIIIGTIILLNQRKIRKELRQLREMMENQDKPQE